MKNRKVPLPELIAFDFDGVFTDNFVYVDSAGKEMVRCSRADGLAIDVLRACKIRLMIISTERNPVVRARARKLNIPCIQGVENKARTLSAFCLRHKIKLTNVLYVGNDLNDLECIKIVGASACPRDSHPKIKRLSTHVLRTRGGCGVSRELVERILKLDYLTLCKQKPNT